LNIYSKKQNWKVFLVITAILIVAASLWYTNKLVKNIAREERNKVKLWAGAIQKKANLVKYTNELFDRIKDEERKKVELWAEATKRLVTAGENEDFSFILKVVTENSTVPVILTDENEKIISYRNLDSSKVNDPEYLNSEIAAMKQAREPLQINVFNQRKNYLYYKDSKLFSELKNVLDDLIKSFISEVVINSASVPVIFTDYTKSNIIAFGNIDSSQLRSDAAVQQFIAEMEAANPPIEIEIQGEKNYIFYQDSFLLTQLRYYPLVQFLIIGVFLIVAYTLFSISRRAEQNQVWIGMAKETAHQLGTPLSSLLGWIDIIKEKGLEEESTEISKDIKRLETITERFSKIGSVPVLEKENLNLVIHDAVNYMKSRTSRRIEFEVIAGGDINAPVNIPLFEWVIENLIRNAVDAMNGTGKITIRLSDQVQFAYIDIADTGKGIPKSKYKTVFEPGFTTKKRGWGLGLSLAKRIIENYHSGKIFVRSSEVDKGTEFRIVLNK